MKKANHQIEVTINANPSAVWDVVGAGTNVDKWLGPITACRVEGDKRYCETADGGFEEDILGIDQDNWKFAYAIPSQHMIPVQNIVAYMQVLDKGDNQAAIVWNWDYEVEEANEAQVKEMFTMIGTMGIEGIEGYVNTLAAA